MNVWLEMARLSLRLGRAAVETQIALSAEALTDCNRFCKLDTGRTLASSHRASNLLLGRLVWETPYVRHAYYLGEADRSKNPLASRMWAHKAAALYSDKWLNTARRRFVLSMLRR
jgi:hypothetical protein